MPSIAQLHNAVRAVIAASFDLDVDELPHPASRETIEAWTEQAHTVLVLNLEQRFDVGFSLEEMMSMTTEDRIVQVLGRIIDHQPRRQ